MTLWSPAVSLLVSSAAILVSPHAQSNANKVLLPLSTGAACLDGSPYAFYIARNRSSTRWTLYFRGGGWCYNESLCEDRAVSKLGTSTLQPAVGDCDCAFYDENGVPDAEQCNCVSLVYCDGASFSGYREQPWPIPTPHSNVSQLMFRGLRNLDATLEFLTAKAGFENATEVVVTGGSAGGLSTFLHADRVAAHAPRLAKVRALPIVGYFLDHPEMSGGSPDYRATMQYVLSMQNVTQGSALSAACLAAYPAEQWKCFMSPYAQAFVETPFFMMNSKFDFWQLGCILDIGCLCTRNVTQTRSNQCAAGPSTCWSNPAPHDSSSSRRQLLLQPELAPPIVGVNCNATQRAAVLEYGASFLAALAPVVAARDERNGAFITSCICHACDWAILALQGKTANGHFADWYSGRTVGASARVVDSRGPNGDGALSRSSKEPGWMNCSDGYYPPTNKASTAPRPVRVTPVPVTARRSSGSGAYR